MTKSSFLFLVRRVCFWTVEATAVCLVAYFVGMTALGKITYSFTLGNRLAGECDAGSEADGLNSGMNYYKRGFLVNGGLPDRGHPPDKLYLDPNEEPQFTLIYTHYPPGPNWLIGLSIHAFGTGKVAHYRFVPIVFSALCMISVYFMLRASLGALVAAGIVVVLMSVPMTTEMMHGLFCHSYTLVLLLLQMAFVYTRLKLDKRLSAGSLSFVFLCSFIQGWLGFDYAFAASLYPLALVSGWRTKESRKMMLLATVCAGSGFTFAHILHIGQLWIFYGTLARSWAELMEAGQYRMNGPAALGETLPRWQVLRLYVVELLPSRTQAGVFSWVLPTTALAVTLLTRFRRSGHEGDSTVKTRDLSSVVALCCGLAISVCWISLMRNHAAEGGHQMFLPRHFILLMFVCLLVIGDELDFVASRVRQLYKSRFKRPTTG